MVSVIVLSWNGRQLLQACLTSLCQQTADYELIVVDNGSHDGSAAMVSDLYPDIRLLVLPVNRGFAGGVNAALQVACGKYLALFNNDATARPGYLQQLAHQLDQQPQLAAVGGTLVFAHAPTVVASAGVELYRDGVALDRAMLQPLAAQNSAPMWGATGGSVMFRRTALQDVGIFDEGYFAYLEDVDLAWRLRSRGWQVANVASAVAEHLYSATGGEGSPFKRWLLARNRWRVLLRCWPSQLLHQHWADLLKYDLLAMAQAAAKGHWATINGRQAAWRDWRALRAQHQLLAQRFTVDLTTMNTWLKPARNVTQTLATSRRLAKIMRLG